ncbi:MAG TPA: hypothetical protein PLV68_16255, partial [Ilumatobacteraceae bacterium]|nr:hypothetical protein [Ilumatobacteraceae bacterium]
VLKEWEKHPIHGAQAKNFANTLAKSMQSIVELKPGGEIKGNRARVRGDRSASINSALSSLTGWVSPETYFSWPFKVTEGGEYHIEVDQATLRDEPTRSRAWDDSAKAGEEIAITFETAALGVSGPVEGAYLGSVEWGFRAPADSATAVPLPFRMISRGAPSAAFLASAKLWNDNATIKANGKDTRLSIPVAFTTHQTDPLIDALLGDPSTPAERLQAAIEARIRLLRSQIPGDIDKQLADLGQAKIDDQEAVSEFRDVVTALSAEWKRLKGIDTALAGAKVQADNDLRAATQNLKAIDDALNVFTRRIGGGKTTLKAAKVDVAGKRTAADKAKTDSQAAAHDLDTAGQQLQAAKTDPSMQAALVTYRASLVAFQNVLADARSRQFEITAL